MKKFKENVITVILVILFGLGLAGLFMLNWHAWKIKHPNAPTWTFFLGH